MYSSEYLERFYYQYQTVAFPQVVSIEKFCLKKKVPYNLFLKWYKDMWRKDVERAIHPWTTKCFFSFWK